MKMSHDADPAKQILDELDHAHDNYDVFGADLLLAIYCRPEKTSGGIILTDNAQGEDLYQGKVGLVLKVGPLVHERNKDLDLWFAGELPAPGDWVVVRVGDTYAFDLQGKKEKVRCRLVEAKQLRGRIAKPDCVW